MGRDLPGAAIGTGNDDVSQKSLVAAQQASGDERVGEFHNQRNLWFCVPVINRAMQWGEL